MTSHFIEKNQKNEIIRTSFINGTKSVRISARHSRRIPLKLWIWTSLARVFLPTGFPGSVTDDYLRYQILNGLQAFCSAVAGLISSRAVLEGVGVGDAAATATAAILITTLQDIFSRLTTVVSAYLLGTALFPEAKRYRLLADLCNDAAIAIDSFVPLLKFNFNTILPAIPSLYIIALCMSGSLRAICGIISTGAKTSISVHFASPLVGKGDLGDLTAKDASIETVLCLVGLLFGTLIVPYLTTRFSATTTVLVLLIAHFSINYYAVRGITLRTVNRQRAALAWTAYRNPSSPQGVIITPASIAWAERIFERSSVIRNSITSVVIGTCTIGSTSLSTILSRPISTSVIQLFASERYILWFDPASLTSSSPFRMHIFLKENYTDFDALKAWLHAVEVCIHGGDSYFHDTSLEEEDHGADEFAMLLTEAYRSLDANLIPFMECMATQGWNLSDIYILTGPPRTVLSMSTEDQVGDEEHELETLHDRVE